MKLETISTERTKNIYASLNACLFALTKIQITNDKGRERIENEDEDEDESFHLITDLKKAWVADPEPYLISLGDTSCDVFIEDEGGKINLNSINNNNKDMFMDYLISKEIKDEKAEEIIDSIIDWIDKDDLHHINGAESQYYESLPVPYKAKNAKLDSIEELLLVKGITSIVFDDIREGVTVFGSEKININFATKDILLAIPGIEETMVTEILTRIETIGPFKDMEELRTFFFSLGIAGASFEDVKKYISIENRNFVTIRSVCSSSNSSPESSSGNSGVLEHQYRIIAEVNDKQKKILAVYPD